MRGCDTSVTPRTAMLLDLTYAKMNILFGSGEGCCGLLHRPVHTLWVVSTFLDLP